MIASKFSLWLQLLVLVSLLTACNAKVTTNVISSRAPLTEDATVEIYEEDERTPASQLVGVTKVKDTGFSTNCSYEYGIAALKSEARKYGANTVQIIKHRKPNVMGSSCHQFDAEIRYMDESQLGMGKQVDSTNTNTQEEEYFADDEELSSMLKEPSDPGYQHPRIRINFQYGFSYRIAQAYSIGDPTIDAYYKDLKSGTHIKGEVHAFLSEKIGLGLTYSQHRAENRLHPVLFEDFNGNVTIGTLSDDIRITFVGPTFMYRKLFNTHNSSFYAAGGLGVVLYEDQASGPGPFTLTSATVATSLGAGFEIGLSKNLAIGIDIALVGGVLTTVTVEEGGRSQTITLEEEEYEGLGRVDGGVGVRFNL